MALIRYNAPKNLEYMLLCILNEEKNMPLRKKKGAGIVPAPLSFAVTA